MRWKYRTFDSERLEAISGASPEDTYERRRSWLEARLIERYEARESDTAEIAGRDEARIRRDQKCKSLRKRHPQRAPDGVSYGVKVLLLHAASNFVSESQPIVDDWREFLRNEAQIYGDYLIDKGTPASAAVDDFARHVDERVADIKERRWPYWRARLHYPDSEGRSLSVLLDAAADAAKREFEKWIWTRTGGLEFGCPRQETVIVVPETDEHSRRLVRLWDHISAAKLGRIRGFRSKADFYQHLGIDRSDYYRWEGQKKLKAPGHKLKIEAAIDSLSI